MKSWVRMSWKRITIANLNLKREGTANTRFYGNIFPPPPSLYEAHFLLLFPYLRCPFLGIRWFFSFYMPGPPPNTIILMSFSSTMNSRRGRDEYTWSLQARSCSNFYLETYLISGTVAHCAKKMSLSSRLIRGLVSDKMAWPDTLWTVPFQAPLHLYLALPPSPPPPFFTKTTICRLD